MRRWIIERDLEHYEPDDDAFAVALDMLENSAEVKEEVIRTIIEIIEDIRNDED